jgi:CheY-like chemotaxis protein
MDDEEPIQKLAGRMLQRMGLEVHSAMDGAEAVEKFKTALEEKRPFDLVVLDLTVPGKMGGREAIGILRDLDPGVKAIVSSGYSSDPIVADYTRFGFAGMVAKPYQVADFARVVRQVLGAPPPPAAS